MSFRFKNHPGTPILVWVVVIGAIAGLPSFERAILGALLMLVVFGPVYLLGAWERDK